MGLDLTAMASHFRERRDEMLPTAVLRFDRDTALLAQLAGDATPRLVQPLPDGLKVGCYEDEGLRFTDTDRYGNKLTYTTSADLAALRVTEEMTQWNRAIIAFLLSLPPENRIVLYWC